MDKPTHKSSRDFPSEGPRKQRLVDEQPAVRRASVPGAATPYRVVAIFGEPALRVVRPKRSRGCDTDSGRCLRRASAVGWITTTALKKGRVRASAADVPLHDIAWPG